MARFDYEIVGKIGSMALIRKDNDIDYNIFSRIGSELRPGIIWVSSGATEIGRLDYMKRNDNRELIGDIEEAKADYSAQGQAILMKNYREFISHKYSVRQLLVEHQHFNDSEKREYVRRFLMRCAAQNAVPIVNYNDPVSFEENRQLELRSFKESGLDPVECIDNDETAAVITQLVRARYMLVLTSVDGIYADPSDPSTLISEISGKDADEVTANIRENQKACIGASRAGANGARAKLEFAIEPVLSGTIVLIANAKYGINDVIKGNCPRTMIGVR